MVAFYAEFQDGTVKSYLRSDKLNTVGSLMIPVDDALTAIRIVCVENGKPVYVKNRYDNIETAVITDEELTLLVLKSEPPCIIKELW